MSSIPVIRCSATVSPTTVSLPPSPPPQIFLHLSITLEHPSPITLYAPLTPLDSRNQDTGHCDYRLRSLATNTILHANTTYGLILGKLCISEPARDLLTLRPGETVTRDVQIGVHDRARIPGRHEPDELRMTVCAVALHRLVPGDYRIELPEVWDGQLGGWYWDEGEMEQVVRRHSPGVGLGWLGSRLRGGADMMLGDEKGGIDMEIVGEAPVLRVTGPSMETVQQDGIAETL